MDIEVGGWARSLKPIGAQAVRRLTGGLMEVSGGRSLT